MKNTCEQYTPKTSEEEPNPKPKPEPKPPKPEKKEEEKTEEEEDKEPLYPLQTSSRQNTRNLQYPTLINIKYESDYEGMSNEAGTELDYHHAKLKELYKGIRYSILQPTETLNQKNRMLKQLDLS